MSSRKILIVDDEADFVTSLDHDLKKKGYITFWAADGEEGLKRLELEKPDLVLLDVKMPRLDGYSFLRKAKKELGANIPPLIVLTSYEPMRSMFELEGVKDFFVKSGDHLKLMELIDSKFNTEMRGAS